MTKKVRAELNRIEAFISQGNADGKALWDILSALRGPDFEFHKQTAKRFTVRVRRAAFPKIARKSWYPVPAAFGKHAAAKRGDKLVAGTDHFKRHIAHAYKALGIHEKPTSWS